MKYKTITENVKESLQKDSAVNKSADEVIKCSERLVKMLRKLVYNAYKNGCKFDINQIDNTGKFLQED